MTRLFRYFTLLMLALSVRLVSAATGSADFAGLVDIGGGRKMYLEWRVQFLIASKRMNR